MFEDDAYLKHLREEHSRVTATLATLEIGSSGAVNPGRIILMKKLLAALTRSLQIEEARIAAGC